jgi:uncharacterized protein YgiM (DUF1202 family)
MKWLKDLKPDDEVIVNARSIRKVMVVERLTRSQIFLKDSTLTFRRSDGLYIHKGLGREIKLEEATKMSVSKVNDNVRKGTIINKIRTTYWHEFEVGDLEYVMRIISKHHKKKAKCDKLSDFCSAQCR